MNQVRRHVISSKKKIWIALLVILLSAALFVGYTVSSNPRLEYEVVNGYSGYHSILTLEKDRSYTLTITPQRGSPTKTTSGTITNEQMKSIRNSLWLNGFLTLNRDLSDYSALDNSTERLNVRVGMFRVETGGYGVTNKRFRNIVKELETLITSQK